MAFATPIGERGPLRPSNQPRPKRPPGLALGAAVVEVGSACRATKTQVARTAVILGSVKV
jgi:hypothetical protein